MMTVAQRLTVEQRFSALPAEWRAKRGTPNPHREDGAPYTFGEVLEEYEAPEHLARLNLKITTQTREIQAMRDHIQQLDAATSATREQLAQLRRDPKIAELATLRSSIPNAGMLRGLIGFGVTRGLLPPLAGNETDDTLWDVAGNAVSKLPVAV